MTNHSIPIKNSTIGGRDDCFVIQINKKHSFIVWVHHRQTPLKIETRNNHDSPVFVAAGTRTYLVVDKTLNKKLGEPYNHCLEDINTFDKNKTIITYILGKNQTYSQINCLDLCFDIFRTTRAVRLHLDMRG